MNSNCHTSVSHLTPTFSHYVCQVQLLELLPKVAATIPKTDRLALKPLQRRCEAAFKELILGGVSGPVSEWSVW